MISYDSIPGRGTKISILVPNPGTATLVKIDRKLFYVYFSEHKTVSINTYDLRNNWEIPS